MSNATLGDAAMAVFAFAAYHQLSTKQPVIKVAATDSAGHAADPDGVRQLQDAGLAKLDGNDIVFTDTGLRRLQAVIAAIGAA